MTVAPFGNGCGRLFAFELELSAATACDSLLGVGAAFRLGPRFFDANIYSRNRADCEKITRKHRRCSAGWRRYRSNKCALISNTMYIRGLVIAVLSLLAVTVTAGAQPVRLSYDLGFDLSLTVAATTALIGSELAKTELAAKTCRWCDRAANGIDTLNGVDAAFRKTLRWDHSSAANVLSSVVAYGFLPATALALLAAEAIAGDAVTLPSDRRPHHRRVRRTRSESDAVRQVFERARTPVRSCLNRRGEGQHSAAQR